MEAVNIFYRAFNSSDSEKKIISRLFPEIGFTGIDAPYIFLQPEVEKVKFKVVIMTKKWEKMYVRNDSGKAESNTIPLSLTSNVNESATFVFIPEYFKKLKDEKKDPPKVNLLLSSDQKFVIDQNGWTNIKALKKRVTTKFKISSVPGQEELVRTFKDLTNWDIQKVEIMPSGLYLIEELDPILRGISQPRLLKSTGELTRSYDTKNLDMNLMWTWNAEDKSLSSYKEPSLSYSRVILSKGLVPYVSYCDPLSSETCMISAGTPGQFILYQNYLTDYETGLCYSISKTHSPSFPLDDTKIKVGDSLVRIALEAKNRMYKYGGNYAQSNCTDKGCVKGCTNNQGQCCAGKFGLDECAKEWCPWSEKCLIDPATLEYCSMNDEFGNPRVLTDKNCKMWFNGPGDNTARNKSVGLTFCSMNPKHPACACINYRDTFIGKSMERAVAKSPALGSIQCMLPQCTTSSADYLGKKETKDCPSNIQLCTSIIEQNNLNGHNLIDDVSIVQICGDSLKSCVIDTDCKNNETCFVKDGRGYCIANSSPSTNVPVNPVIPGTPGTSVPNVPETVPDTPIPVCKYGEKVYGRCEGGKRSITQKVISGGSTCTDIFSSESCSTCEKDTDCGTGKVCKNNICELKIDCTYGDEIKSPCMAGKQTITRKAKGEGCKDIVIADKICVMPVIPDEKEPDIIPKPVEEEDVPNNIALYAGLGIGLLFVFLIIGIIMSRRR